MGRVKGVKGVKKPPASLRAPPDKIFGPGKPLLRTKLPLFEEVGAALVYRAERNRLRREEKEIDCQRASSEVAQEVLQVYSSASIPTISEIRCTKK